MKKKVALVTGGSRGLGRNMALAIASKGLDVIITYHHNRDKAIEVLKELAASGQKGIALQLDVNDFKSFPSFLEEVQSSARSEFGTDRIDFLVNNAGTGVHKPFSDTPGEDLDHMYHIHFKGPYLLSQAALKIMNDGGGIINISSGLTRIIIPGYSCYAAMKTAIENITLYQAKELGERKIRCNVIAPGAIETDFGGGVVRDNAELNAFIASTTALGRVGLPDDIGGVVAFLCTEEAKWINAQRIEVSGGQMI